MSTPPRRQPQASVRLPAFWNAAARIAIQAAVIMLSLRGNALLTAAGLLAAGTAIAARAEARFRTRRGQSSDLAYSLTITLALATVLTCILALAAANQPSQGHRAAVLHAAPAAARQSGPPMTADVRAP